VHTRLRKLISAGFTPRMIGLLDEQVRRRTAQILDAVEAKGECEFVDEVAYALPMHIIADIVGIPDADRPWVFARTDTCMRANDPVSGVDASDVRAAEVDLFAYAERLGEEKRRRPADDVWSVLATVEVDDDEGGRTRLEGVELDMFFLILSLAGSETTRNAISHGLLTLLEHPDQMADVREAARGGGGPLLDSAAEEIIRWASPVTCFSRTATHDVEIGGAEIRQGDRVTMWYPSANRDEDVFADPFRFDVRRSPNPHVSFGGGGVHYCLGAHLARREVRVMFEQLLARFDAIEVTGPVARTASGPDQTVAVSVSRCPVRLTPRAS
jgi:cytochrome P450